MTFLNLLQKQIFLRNHLSQDKEALVSSKLYEVYEEIIDKSSMNALSGR